jgi:hypothetical protein
MKTTLTPSLKRNLMPLGLSLDQNELAGISNILTGLVFRVPIVILILSVFKVLSRIEIYS